MLPTSQASCTPSVVQVKSGCSLGTHPPCKHCSFAGHVVPPPHAGTQWSCEHTVPKVQTLGFDSHGVGSPVQVPLASHEYPVGHACVALHVGVQAPCTHWSPV